MNHRGMNNKNKIAKAVLRFLVMSTLSLSLTSYAEENDETKAEDDGPTLGTIVVTARKRAENIMDVPDTVVLLSEDYIERANISAARDITTRIPNISITESLSPTSTFIIVRGISSVRNSEPAVAMVIDGVQVGSQSEISQSFYDVESIQVLKGPQGALYGRNALGGAIIINSKKPSDTVEGKVIAGIGDNGLTELFGSVTGPLSESVFLRLSVNHKSFDGNIENEYLTRVKERSNANAIAGSSSANSYMDFEEMNDYRAQVLWEVNDELSVDYRYSHNGLEAGSMWYRNIYRMESDPSLEYEFPINSQSVPVAIREIDSHTLKIDNIFNKGTLTSITNFNDTNERYGVAGEGVGGDRTGNVLFYTQPFVSEFLAGLTNPIDIDFFSAELGLWDSGVWIGSDQYYDIETISQEFRFASEPTNLFRYTAGAYFLLTERADTIRNTWENPFGAPFDCVPNSAGIYATDFSTCNGLINSTQNIQDNFAYAVYLSTDYNLSDNLTLTSAFRYDSDKREVTRIDGPTVDTFGLGLGACDSVADPENCAAAGSTLEETFSSFQPKLSLAYKTGDATYYTTLARGFRSGGFNASGALLTDTYDKETLDSFEVGFKSKLMDNRLRVSTAIFYQDYTNAQQFEFDGNVFVQSLYNIPESSISGIEASVEFAATDALTVNTAFGLMDSEIEKFDDDILSKMLFELGNRVSNSDQLPGGTQTAFDNGFKGEKLPNFAHKTLNIGIEHNYSMSNGRYLTTRVDYSYFGDRYWWLDGEDVQDGVSLLEGSVSIELADNWELSLWCKNCTDEFYDSEYAPNEKELFGGAAKDVAYQARGRTFGLRTRFSF
ncbi:MAG: TonB-dependent receptor [Kangiellaceae bacterium]|nr:TonB-dependent receptor [Kangiellaceae bacterium]